MIVLMHGITRSIEIGDNKRRLSLEQWRKAMRVLHKLWDDGWATASFFQGGIAYSTARPMVDVVIEVHSGVADVAMCPRWIAVEIVDFD